MPATNGPRKPKIQREPLQIAAQQLAKTRNSGKGKPGTVIPQRKQHTKKRIYVLDTNVLMHDPSCLFRFQEHDIYITSQVLEELDDHKKGHDEINRNVREVSRTLETILSSSSVNITEGVPLSPISRGIATGKLFLQTDPTLMTQGVVDKADNRILAAVLNLKEKRRGLCDVVLVSKDGIMRTKGRMAGILVEDYHNDMVIEDTDLLYQGTRELPSDFWDSNKTIGTWKEGHVTYYTMSGPFVKNLSTNEFVHTTKGGKPFSARVIKKEKSITTLKVTHDYSKGNNAVGGILAKNLEQNFALNLLLDPEVDLVTLVGRAGSGKTLLTLAAAITQTIDENLYSEIIFTRVTIPVGEDIGFLPGTEEDKMGPWMGALDDNLDVLGEVTPHKKEFSRGSLNDMKGMKDLERRERKDLIRERIKVKSLSFMRGRTFLRKFLIIDEAQNLTPKQMKMLITRAGPGTKIVCLGNLSQIDTPYLTEGSSGLTYLVDRFKGWEHGGHVMLFAGERSRLASHANDVL